MTLCAAMIPSLLSDNFDYQTLDDVVHGVLGNEEVRDFTVSDLITVYDLKEISVE